MKFLSTCQSNTLFTVEVCHNYIIALSRSVHDKMFVHFVDTRNDI